LLSKYGSTGTRQLLSKFWVESRPAYTAVDEGRAFFRFISEAEEKLPDLLKAMASDEDRITQLLNEV